MLGRLTSLDYAWNLGIVTATLLLATVSLVGMFGVQVDNQFEQASQQADDGVQRIRELANRYPSLNTVLRSTPFIREIVSGTDPEEQSSSQKSNEGKDSETKNEPTSKEDSENANSDEQSSNSSQDRAKAAQQSALRNTVQKGASALAGVFKTTFGLLVNSALIFFVGLFLATSPHTYRDGLVKLFPIDRRERTREILDLMGEALWNWLVGRFATMMITGSGAGLLLLLLQVPMAITLGIVTALLTFIPNIGGVIALVLAVLFALPKGGTVVFLVVIGYLGLQIIESYVVTPLIQQRQVSLPPALLISFQAIMGVVFGFLGAAVASPLLAATKVGVEEAYVKDFLED